MVPGDLEGEDAVRAEFLEALFADRASGGERTLTEYLAMFPGYEDVVRREYLAQNQESKPTKLPGEGLTADQPAAGGNQLGPYRVLRQLGRGGQATVYLAEDTRLHRQVALKVLDPGFAAGQNAFERFKREAEITSRLDHPGICAIFETGEDRGVRWIAMHHVDGESLAAKIATAKEHTPSANTSFISISARHDGGEHAGEGAAPKSEPPSGPTTWVELVRILSLFEATARILHVAHEHGVVHRDIKPGNIMVTKEGDPVILDFGLAQEMTGDQATLTLTGDIMGTPAYMSPEQIAAKRIRLDRRTDVYSLGISLYECLTLRRPFDAPTRDGIYQAILSKSPPDVCSLNRSVPRDLKVVLETTIDKDRDRRYQTADDFAEDLRRVRMHEPIRAKPAGAILRLRRWSQRNPALAVAVFGLFVTLAAGLLVSLRLLAARNAALQKSEVSTTATKRALEDKSAELDRSEGRRVLALSQSHRVSNPGLSLLLAIEGAGRAPGSLANNTILDALGELREVKTLYGHTGAVVDAGFLPSGGRVATASSDGTIRVWDRSTGGSTSFGTPGVETPFGRFDEAMRRAITRRALNEILVWDLAAGTALPRLTVDEGAVVVDAVLTPDGSRVAAIVESPARGGAESRASTAVTLVVWSVPDGARITTFEIEPSDDLSRPSRSRIAAMSQDGKRFVTITRAAGAQPQRAREDAVVFLHKLDSRTPIPLKDPRNSNVHTASFNRLGTRLVTAPHDNTPRVWNTESGRPVTRLEGPDIGVTVARFVPEGLKIVSGSIDGTVRLWSADDRREVNAFRNHEAAVTHLAFSRDGRRLAILCDDGTARVWDVGSAQEVARISGHDAPLSGAAFNDTGDEMVTVSPDGTARIWAVGPRARKVPTRQPWQHVKLSPGAAYVVSTSDRLTRVLDTRTGDDVGNLSHPARFTFSADGSLAASMPVWQPAPVRLFEVPKLAEVFATEPESTSGTVAISQDGGRLFVSPGSNSPSPPAPRARIWDRRSGGGPIQLDLQGTSIACAAFSPDGRELVTGFADGGVRIWAAETGAGRDFLGRHAKGILAVAYSVDGRRIATASDDATARIWEAASGRCTAVLQDHEGPVRFVAFDPAGRRVVTGSNDRTARLWDAESGRCIYVLGGHPGPVGSIAWSADGVLVLTTSSHGPEPTPDYLSSVRLWNAASGNLVWDRDVREDAVAADFERDGRNVIIAWGTEFERVPTSPADEALRRKPRELTLGEIERFDIGLAADRAAVRALMGADGSAEIRRRIESSPAIAPVVRRAALQELEARGARDAGVRSADTR